MVGIKQVKAKEHEPSSVSASQKLTGKKRQCNSLSIRTKEKVDSRRMVSSSGKNTSYTPIHPGEILREEYMNDRGLDSKMLADKLSGVESGQIEDVINERAPITHELSKKLGKFMGISENFWLKLQQKFDNVPDYETRFSISKLKLAMVDAGIPFTKDELEKQKIIIAAFSAMEDGVEIDSLHAQKIMFLIDNEVDSSIGVPFFNHILYKHGTNDNNINSILGNLANEGFIEIKYPNKNFDWAKRRYVLKKEGRYIGEKILKLMPDIASEKIADIVEWAMKLNWKELKSEIYKKYPEMNPETV